MFTIEGSFIIAGICKDGIVIGSDSRGNIFDQRNVKPKPIGCYDTAQKIFPLGQTVLAETGQGLIVDEFFPAIVDRFSRSYPTAPIQSLLEEFIQDFGQRAPQAAVAQMRKQKLFAAGFSTSAIPMICYFNQDQGAGPFGCVCNRGYIQSAPTPLPSPETMAALTALELSELIEQNIGRYAATEDHWQSIGGPISILLLTAASGSTWLKNPPVPQRWNTIGQFIQDYREHKLTISPIPPASRKDIDELLLGPVVTVDKPF